MKKAKITQLHRENAVLTRCATKQYTQKEGITLISLVVTIIILLILAGVTLALISGSDGILGRAANALDENKIAMAKEQVELALSDFQAEFFDEKYVERTNNGTKKDYISEKLQAGVETTNFYAQASSEGNVVVYEGKDSSGTEVVKGSIQEDASIKWDNDGNSGENGGSSEGGNGSPSTGEGIDSADLRNTIAQLQNKVEALENQQKTANRELETTQNELNVTKETLEKTNNTLNSILTSQTRQDIIFERTSTVQTGETYNFVFPEGKTLSDYKMLCFFVDVMAPNGGTGEEQIALVEPKVEREGGAHILSYTWPKTGNIGWVIWFSIIANDQFKVDEADYFPESNYEGIRIYKVIGIY